jgi:hypothetical protein
VEDTKKIVEAQKFFGGCPIVITPSSITWRRVAAGSSTGTARSFWWIGGDSGS